MQKLDRLVWAASTSLRVGEFLVGIRSNLKAADDIVRRALAPHVVPADAIPNFSIRMHAAGSTSARSVHTLYRGCTAVLRTTQPREMFDYLLRRLDEECLEPPADALRVRASAFARRHEAILLPDLVGTDHEARDQMRRRGWRLVPAERADLHAREGQVIIARPRLRLDEAILDGVLAFAGGDNSEPPLPWDDRVPLRLWTFIDGTGEDDPQPPRAQLLARGLHVVDNLPAVGVHNGMALLASLLNRTPAYVLPRAKAGDVGQYIEEKLNV